MATIPASAMTARPTRSGVLGMPPPPGRLTRSARGKPPPMTPRAPPDVAPAAPAPPAAPAVATAPSRAAGGRSAAGTADGVFLALGGGGGAGRAIVVSPVSAAVVAVSPVTIV